MCVFDKKPYFLKVTPLNSLRRTVPSSEAWPSSSSSVGAEAAVGAEVKVISGLKDGNLYLRLFCQLWFEELGQPLVTPVWRVQMLRCDSFFC